MLQRWLVVIVGLPLLLAAFLLCPSWATLIVVCGISAAAAYELLFWNGSFTMNIHGSFMTGISPSG